jgi:hypothetical protein
VRLTILVLGILLGAAAAGPPAQAQNYPWCARYGGGRGGAQNCGFVSFDQCMATVRGIGGYCARNPQYFGPQLYRRGR